MRFFKRFLAELSVPQQWLLGVGLVLVGLFLFVVPPFQKPDEQVHFFRAIGVAQGNFICSKNQDGIFENQIPAYLAELPDDAYVSHLAFNDEVKFSWKVFLANARHPDKVIATPGLVSPTAGQLVNTPKACSLPFLMYVPMALVLAAPVSLQADPVLIFFLGRVAQTVLSVGLWLAAVILTPKKLRLLPLFILVIPMVPHQLTSYSKDALHLSAGMVAVAAWLRLLELRLVVLRGLKKATLLSWQRQQMRLLVILVVSIGVLVLARPQYGFWLLLPLTVLPVPLHGRLAKKVRQLWRWLMVVSLGVVTVLALIGLSLKSEMYSSNAHTVGVLVESTSGIYPAVQLRYLMSYPTHIFAIANQTIETYGIFYLVSMIGQLGWLDNTMYWFVIGGVVGGLVAIMIKIRPAVPVLQWWQQLIVVGVIVGSLAGLFGGLYLYGSPVASPVVEAVQGRYFLLLLPLVVVLAAQFRWQQQRWLAGLVLAGLVMSVVVATFVRYYAFDDYYYLQEVPQVVLKTFDQDEKWQARLQLEVGKKLRGVVLIDAVSTMSATMAAEKQENRLVVPYQLLIKDANCQDVSQDLIIDHRQWAEGNGRVEALFPAQLIVASSICVELLPYGVEAKPENQLRLQSGATAEVLYVH